MRESGFVSRRRTEGERDGGEVRAFGGFGESLGVKEDVDGSRGGKGLRELHSDPLEKNDYGGWLELRKWQEIRLGLRENVSGLKCWGWERYRKFGRSYARDAGGSSGGNGETRTWRVFRSA